MINQKGSVKRKFCVIFFTHYTQLYGANRSLLDLIDGLSNQIRPIVVVPKCGDITLELENRKIKFIQSKNVFFFHKRNIGLIKVPFKLVLFTIINIRLLLKIKRIYPILLYSNSSVIFGGLFLSKILNIPHIWHVRELMEKQFKLKSDFGLYINKYLLSNSNHIITNSHFTKENTLSGVTAPISVVYNGIINNKTIGKQDIVIKSISEDKIIISIIGRIMRDKGQFEAIEAFNALLLKFQNIELWIVGSVDEKDYYLEIMQYIDKVNISEHIKFIGYTKNINKIYNNTNILLMCSDFEAMGRVTVEAFARGIPVIGKNKGGTKELILHNENGYLYNNKYELVDYILRLVQNPTLYSRFSSNAISESYKNYTIEEYSNRIYNIIKSIIRFE